MVIKIYRNGFGAWEPTCDEWKTHRANLRDLCVSGTIAFKRKEDLISYFGENDIIAVEEGSAENTSDTEQLMLF